MKTLNKGKVLLLICIIWGIVGCSLFKKTSKDSAKSKQEQTKQIESTKVDLKTADKETHVYTYWNDSVLYQYQNIKERVEQAQYDQVKAQEKQKLSTEQVVKKSEPVNAWVYIGVVALVVAGWLVYKRVLL